RARVREPERRRLRRGSRARRVGRDQGFPAGEPAVKRKGAEANFLVLHAEDRSLFAAGVTRPPLLTAYRPALRDSTGEVVSRATPRYDWGKVNRGMQSRRWRAVPSASQAASYRSRSRA